MEDRKTSADKGGFNASPMLDTVSHTTLVTNDRTNITQRLESELQDDAYGSPDDHVPNMETEGLKTIDVSEQYFGRHEKPGRYKSHTYRGGKRTPERGL